MAPVSAGSGLASMREPPLRVEPAFGREMKETGSPVPWLDCSSTAEGLSSL